METMAAFIMGELTRGRELMVFDWNKAAKLIKESGMKDASAGLRGDWEYTGGDIFTDGEPNLNSYTFLASTWAIPELEIDGEVVECYKMQSEVPEWGADTKWPESALAILKGDGSNGS
jgi:hypothetical protein